MTRQTLNNGVYLGYDQVANAVRTDSAQTYQVWFDKPTRPLGTLREESIQAAKNIRASTDKEIVVLYSGGLDSEWTLESFRLAGIPVTALVCVYSNDMNKHDVDWAKFYLKRSGHSKVMWYEADLRVWYNNPLQKEIAWNCQTPELAYTAQYRAILGNRSKDRIFITSYDEPLLVANDSSKVRTWEMTYSERHYSVVKFFEHYEIDGCSNWSRQNENLFAAYVTQPQWQLLAANMFRPLAWNSELIKIQMYQAQFGLVGRPKYTGFEGGLDFIVEGSNQWRKEMQERGASGTWVEDYKEDIHSVWAKLGFGK